VIFDAASIVATHTIQAHTAEVLRVSYSRQALLASAGRDGLVRIFDGTRGYSLLQKLENHGANMPTTSLAFAVDGTKLVTIGGDATLSLCTVDKSLRMPVTKFRRVRTRPIFGTAYDVAVDATAKYAICAGPDARLDVRSLLTGKRVRSYELADANATKFDVYRLCVDNAGVHAACCYFNGVVRLFDFYSGSCLATTNGHGDLVTCLTFSADGSKLLTAGSDGCVHTWGLTPELVRIATERDSELRAAQCQKKEASNVPTWAQTYCQRDSDLARLETVSSAGGLGAGNLSVYSNKPVTKSKSSPQGSGIPPANSRCEESMPMWPTVEVHGTSVLLPVTSRLDEQHQVYAVAPSLRQERSALRSRQRGQETTIAVRGGVLGVRI